MHKLKSGISIAIVASITLVLSFLFLLGLFSNIQTRLSDELYGGIQPRDDIVIVAIDDKSLQAIGRWPWDRKEFAGLFPLLNQSKIIGIDVAFFEPSKGDKALISSAEKAGNIVIPVEYTRYVEGKDRLIGAEILLPIDGLEQAAYGLGYINVLTDRDGVTRAVNTNIQGDYNSFVSEIYEKYTETPFHFQNSRMLINFVDKPGSFKTYSFTEVSQGEIPPSAFKDKIVFIGATSPDLQDTYFVPTSGGKAMPGVEVHANTMQTLLDQEFLQTQPPAFVIIGIFLASLITMILVSLINLPIAAIIVIVLILAYIFLSIFAFAGGIIMDLLYLPISFLSTYTIFLIHFYTTEKKEKKQIVNTFGKYVSPVLVNEIIQNPDKLKLGGQKRTITVFFSDIRGFTSLSEKLDPEKLVHLLNTYLTEMTNIVMDKRGLVDKFIGDAIMAIWGAPLDEKKHATLACEASLEMMDQLKILNQQWKKQGSPEIKIGIGLSTGHAVVGNMGSEERFDYTAMGDMVNLGARLEGLTKQYAAPIIISEATKKEIKNEFFVRTLDFVTVQGKKKPIQIYQLMAKKPTPQLKELKKYFEQGLKLYREKKWDQAIKAFKKCINQDPTSNVFIERCLKYKADPPLKDWEGAWVTKK